MAPVRARKGVGLSPAGPQQCLCPQHPYPSPHYQVSPDVIKRPDLRTSATEPPNTRMESAMVGRGPHSEALCDRTGAAAPRCPHPSAQPAVQCWETLDLGLRAGGGGGSNVQPKAGVQGEAPQRIGTSERPLHGVTPPSTQSATRSLGSQN